MTASPGAIPLNLSDELVNDAKEMFSVWDQDSKNEINFRDVGDVLRAMGFHPKLKDIEHIIAIRDPEGTGICGFDLFLKILSNWIKQVEDDDELRNAFKVLDTEGNGIISNEKLREILTTLGEKLDDEEVEELIRDADLDGDGYINFEEFHMILSDQMG